MAQKSAQTPFLQLFERRRYLCSWKGEKSRKKFSSEAAPPPPYESRRPSAKKKQNKNCSEAGISFFLAQFQAAPKAAPFFRSLSAYAPLGTDCPPSRRSPPPAEGRRRWVIPHHALFLFTLLKIFLFQQFEAARLRSRMDSLEGSVTSFFPSYPPPSCHRRHPPPVQQHMDPQIEFCCRPPALLPTALSDRPTCSLAHSSHSKVESREEEEGRRVGGRETDRRSHGVLAYLARSVGGRGEGGGRGEDREGDRREEEANQERGLEADKRKRRTKEKRLFV